MKNVNSGIATSDKSIINPLIVNGEIVAYLPLETPDNTEQMLERARKSTIERNKEWNEDRRSRELKEALEEVGEKQKSVMLAHLRTLTVFLQTGKTVFTGNKQYRSYQAKFDPSDNSYKLLVFLATRFIPEPAEKIAEVLNEPRSNSNSPTPERRVRDTIKQIRHALQITKQDDFFIVSKNKFGINCNTELRRA